MHSFAPTKPGILVISIVTLMGCSSCAPEVASYEDCILENVEGGMDESAVLVVTVACAEKFPTPVALPAEALRKLSGSLTVQQNVASGTIYNGNSEWTIKEVMFVPRTEGFDPFMPLPKHSTVHVNVDIAPLNETMVSFDSPPSFLDPVPGLRPIGWFVSGAEGIQH
jgi:hypothetical protein